MKVDPLDPAKSAEVLLDDAEFVEWTRGDFEEIKRDGDAGLDAEDLDELIEELVRV
jgi:hypothetical protein